MTLEELKEHVDAYIEHGHGKDIVLITTADPSMGARASVEVTGIYSGFDWEHGQMRISTAEKIVKYGRSRDDDLPPYVYTYDYPNGRKGTVIICRRCEHHLRKTDEYCPRCGQKIGK